MARHNNAHIAAQLFNKPHMIEPSYGQVFVSALAPRLNVQSLTLGDGTEMYQPDMAATAEAYSRTRGKLYHEMQGIAIIPVDGTLVHNKFGGIDPESGMTNYSSIQMKAEAAAADPDVRGIVLDINSPGGSAAGVFNLSQQLAEIAESKPIWGVVDELACSAAYALASACTKIVAPENAMLGSIGVVMMHVDQSEMVKGMGLNVTYIFSGDHKVDGNSFEPMPSDVQADFQQGVDATRDRFVQLVATNRGMDPQAVYDTQARVYDAAGALEAGLLDEIMRTDKVLEAFSASLRASTPARLSATLIHGARNMALPLWGRNKASTQTGQQAAQQHHDQYVTALESAGFTVQTNADGNVTSIGVNESAESLDIDQLVAAHAAGALSSDQVTAALPAIAQMTSGETLYTEAEARDAFAPADNSASLDAIVTLCGEHNLDALAKPLHDRGATAADAQAVIEDAQAIRDRVAVSFQDQPDSASGVAEKLIMGVYGQATPQVAPALGAFMVEARAMLSGEEVDHHPPTGQQEGASSNALVAAAKRQNGSK